MPTIALDTTALVPTIRDSLRCELEAKLGVLLTERQAIDIARNLAQAVIGLEVDETHVVCTPVGLVDVAYASATHDAARARAAKAGDK